MKSPPSQAEKKIGVCEIWNKREKAEIPDKWKDIRFIATRRTLVGPEWHHYFVDSTDTKFNWLLKLWSKLNNL